MLASNSRTLSESPQIFAHENKKHHDLYVRFIVKGCGDTFVKFETANENHDGIRSKWENRIGGQNVFWHSNSDFRDFLIKNETDAIAIWSKCA